MEKHRCKLQSHGGFTLVETMIVVLILLMVSSVVAAGLPVAVNVLDSVVEASNAQLLLSTTMTALRDELSMARDITVGADGTTIQYTNSRGLRSEISPGTDGIYLKVDGTTQTGLLVSRETASKSRKTGEPVLYATYTKVGFKVVGSNQDKSVLTFEGLAVMRNGKKAATTGVKGDDSSDSIYSIRIVGCTDNS